MNLGDWFKGDKIILMVALLLMLISIIAVFSSTTLLAGKSGDRVSIVRDQLVSVGLGLGVMAGCYFGIRKTGIFRFFSQFGFIVALAFLCILMFKIPNPIFEFSEKVNARRVLLFHGMQIHVFEIVKVVMVMYVAWAVAGFKEGRFKLLKSFAEKNPAFSFLGKDITLEIVYIFIPMAITIGLVVRGSNSAAILRFHEMDLDMVRAGIILYGLYPSSDVPKDLHLLPVMELKTVVSLVKNLPAGTPISYSRAFVTDREMTVATVPIGYADGYPRRLSGRMEMLVNGKRAPIAGNICMDQCMLDVTGIEGVTEGTEVTVFGADHGAFIGVDELAEQAGLINYEVICGLSRRVPRIYLKNNEIIEVTDYML